MSKKGLVYGFPEASWAVAKEEARNAMIACARVKGTIPYSDLARQITSITLDAHDPRLFHMLGQISSEEDSAGRGMLSVLVVHKHGDMRPGPGFFEMAKQLGRDTRDIDRCWIDELNEVHAVWSKAAELK